MIQFDRVSFQYAQRSVPAISEIECCVPEGSIALVTGPSGSGKSTLARCVNGLIPHFHGGRFGGRVTVSGLHTTGLSTASLSRHVGFVAQIPESQTVTDRVEDEIAFGPENLGMARSELRVRVEETIDLLGLHVLRHRRIETLSGGERQRVVIAAAMALRPEVLVLDEPTSQLDPSSAEAIISVLRRLNDELGTTILLVEHRLDRALGIADRLIILDESGRMAAHGPTRKLVQQLPSPPPLVRAASELRWEPVPLTVREGRRFDVERKTTPSSVLSATPATTDGAQPTVSFERVSFGYERDPVLDRLSLAFHPGSLTALMGRNGSGKTTLLKLVNGLLRPSSGRVLLDGHNIAARSTTDIARTTGYLPQNAGTLLFNESVAEELRFSLRCRGLNEDPTALLESLDLADLTLRNPLDLSGGERLRAAIAAVLVGRPRILLFDEPTRGVDAQFKERLGRMFRQLAGDGATVILATHDVDMVAEFADRVVILGDGNVIADGSPHNVMPGSLVFAPQINRVFGDHVLTVRDVLDAYGSRSD